MDVPCIYLVNINGISMDIPHISTPSDIHGISMDIVPFIYSNHHDAVYYVGGLHRHGIYHVYTMYIPGIYRKYWFQMFSLLDMCDMTIYWAFFSTSAKLSLGNGSSLK
jgi:hypothetical protein